MSARRPTWHEFFVSNGIPHQTEREAHRILAKHSIEPQDYDKPVDGFWWETRFDLETGPTARAYYLLKKLDLGPTLKRSTEQPHLVFCKGDVANEDSRWVDCHFAFNFEIRRVGCRKATFFALKGEMPIRFVRCSLIPACERGAVSGARYDRRWRAIGPPCGRSGARQPWRTLSGPVPSPSQPAARPCKRCLTLRGKISIL